MIAKKRTDQLERSYWSKKENSLIGAQIRKKMGLAAAESAGNESHDDEDFHDGVGDFERDLTMKKNKSVKIVEGDAPPTKHQTGGMKSALRKNTVSRSPGAAADDDFAETRKRSRSRKSTRSEPPMEAPVNVSPRRQIFEAKYEKFLANKAQKETVASRARAMEKEDFDTVTRVMSPSKKAARFAAKGYASKYDESTLIPDGYEDDLLRVGEIERRNKDPFKSLGVSDEDKMTFFLLKWVFNAIKRDSDPSD